jgi:hypothetical protein
MNLIVYGQKYIFINNKLSMKFIKSDFDIIRELNQLHKKTINYDYKEYSFFTLFY